jgi:adhesin transport system outer membrane protein
MGAYTRATFDLPHSTSCRLDEPQPDYMRLKRSIAATAAWALLIHMASAQPSDPLRDAAQKAIVSNPDVTSRFNAFRSAADAVDVARGAWYPRVDMQAAAGNISDRISTRAPASSTVNYNGVALQVTQMLWDGLSTKYDVSRLDHEKLARYFEFLDTSEQTALEAARVYYDVLRYRRLVALAEDNYVQHKYAFTQIQSRVRAGVGRGVDLEQVGARLALAESNLSTEIANLHDVSARYQRIIGEAPPARLPLPAPLNVGVPGTAVEVMASAVARNAAVSASIEGLRAARAAASQRDSLFQPRVEARVRSGTGNHFDGVADQRRDTNAEITLNWNLYNGGSDRARVRQQANLVAQAADLRDKACRDTRQTALIAFNDTRKLADQLTFLDRNVLAIEKARDAYRQQFDINQRSLLDLLNAEDELYTAKRSYANAEYDHGLAYARAHAAMQQLTVQLGLRRADAQQPEADVSQWSSGDDAPLRCPTTTVEVHVTDRTELDARAQRLLNSSPPPAPPAAPRR